MHYSNDALSWIIQQRLLTVARTERQHNMLTRSAHSIGAASPTTLMVPATASPDTTCTSSSVTSSRTPPPRSASAVAVTCTSPWAPTAAMLQRVLSAASRVAAHTASLLLAQVTSPSTSAGLPFASMYPTWTS